MCQNGALDYFFGLEVHLVTIKAVGVPNSHRRVGCGAATLDAAGVFEFATADRTEDVLVTCLLRPELSN